MDVPQFLRFNGVELSYRHYTFTSVAEKCQLFVDYLQPLKKTLNDANTVHFIGAIDSRYRYFFSDHSQFLDHLQNELLPICSSARGYKFEVYFYSDTNAGANLIASILEMNPIVRCLALEIQVYGEQSMHLPVESITNWLSRKFDGIKIKEQSKERFLKIYSMGIQNAHVLWDYLKEVIKHFDLYQLET